MVDGDSHCAAFNAIVAANRDRLEIRAFARGHAHSCPDCRELIDEPRRDHGHARPADADRRPGNPRLRPPKPAPAPAATRPGARRRRGRRRGRRDGGVRDRPQVALDHASATAAGPADVAPPSPVTGLTATTRRTVFAKPGITVTWETATDDVGVAGYEVYVDGSLAGQTADTSFVVTGLDCGRSVSVGVDAYDGAGNRSSMASLPASTGRC